jgi:hypothetical protein
MENILSIDQLVLIAEATPDVAQGIRAGYTINAIGGDLLEITYGAQRWASWEALKREFWILICTSDVKYAALREKIGSSATKSEATLTSTIAVALSTHLGIAAGLLVPACALCLIALLKIGKEALCTTFTSTLVDDEIIYERSPGKKNRFDIKIK